MLDPNPVPYEHKERYAPMKVYDGTWTPDDIYNWLEDNQFSHFFELDDRVYFYLYHHPKPFMLLILNDVDEEEDAELLS